ncbi:MAG: sialate O-acetylesterase, partial [Sphingobacteriales bacterium 12-47-4]
KQEVGERLAAEAMHTTYGKKEIISQGPMFKFATMEGEKMVLTFDQVGSGLMARGGALKHFAVAGEDKKFYWADAAIKDNKVILTCKQVPKPVAVRYAWSDSPVDANLYNKEGFPASPFRTDSW